MRAGRFRFLGERAGDDSGGGLLPRREYGGKRRPSSDGGRDPAVVYGTHGRWGTEYAKGTCEHAIRIILAEFRVPVKRF